MAHKDALRRLKPCGDLVRAPVLSGHGYDHGPCGRINTLVSPDAPAHCQSMSLLRMITALTIVEVSFPANGGLMNTNHFYNLCLRKVRFQKSINLVSLFLGKLHVGSHTVPVL